MVSRKLLLLTTFPTLLMAINTPLRAADLDLAPADWSQYHIGVGGGYGSVNHEIEGKSGGASLDVSGIGGEGWHGTIEGGADFQMGSSFVVGIAADYTYSDIATTLTLSLPPDSVDGSVTATHSTTVLGRAGFLFLDSALLYGLVGYTHTWWESDASINGSNVSGDGYDVDNGGLTVGGGIEALLGGGLSAKLEYRYTDYSSIDLLEVLDIAAGAGDKLSFSPNAQSIRAVVSYRF